MNDGDIVNTAFRLMSPFFPIDFYIVFLRLLQDMKICWPKQLELSPWKVNIVILCWLFLQWRKHF